MDALDCQVQMFGALLDCQMQMIGMLLNEVCGVWAAINWLSTSGASSLQVVVSTMSTDEDEDEEGEDMDRAVEGDGTESGDDEDGERVDIMLMGTGADLGESAGEEEKDKEEEAEGSRPVCTAEVETFMPPTPLGHVRMPCSTTHAWKGKGVEKMCWEEI